MKDYVAPQLRCILLKVQDVVTASNDLEFDVGSWLSDNQTNDWVEGGVK